MSKVQRWITMSNDLELLEQALQGLTREDFLDVMSQLDQVAWIENTRILKGKQFSFANRDYLLAPYRDESRDLIFYKGRQVEMSEFSMNWLLNKLDRHPYTAGLHTFPRDSQCVKFSKQRLDSAIRDSEKLKAWYADRDSEIKMRKFLRTNEGSNLQPYNFYILGGTWESRKDSVGDAARGTSLDFIVYDERQDHPDDVETVVGEGISHSEYKQTLTLGTPKLPGTQFDLQWESSDKKYWYVKCEHCGRFEPITMDDILDSGDEDIGYVYACRKCRSPLDRNNGTWIADSPKKRPPYSGYHINQLMVCWLSPNDIMKKWNSNTYPKRRFYNEVLGFAYGGDDIPITLQMMMACAENQETIGSYGSHLYVGVDWGSTSYMTILQKTDTGHKLVDCETCEDSDPRKHPKHFAKYLARYARSIKNIVCDAGPDITYAYNLRDEVKKMNIIANVWACYYTTPPAKTLVRWDDDEMNVIVGRSEMIEFIADEVAERRLILPGVDKSIGKIEEFIDHHTNIAAEKGKTAGGMDYIMYVNTGPDHFLHSSLYAHVAAYNGVVVPIGGTAAPMKHGRENSMQVKSAVDKLLLPRTNTASALFPKFGKNKRR